MDAPQLADRFAQRLSAEEALSLIGPVLGSPREGQDVVLAPPLGAGPWPTSKIADENPFVRYRRMLWSYDVAAFLGWSDEEFVGLVTALDDAVGIVDGTGFRVTPVSEQSRLGAAIAGFHGKLLVKDETANVSGSHKGRHLFGLALHLELLSRAGNLDLNGRRLAIASCGNAALAAAVIARAMDRELDVFVPATAASSVLARLADLGAEVIVCERRDGEIGDPSYLRFVDAVTLGAIPFCCQGPDNGLTLDGGRTIGFELADQLGSAGADRVFVQVGGGALATGVSDGLAAAFGAGIISREPHLHPVQTEGGYPLVRAYDSVFGASSSDASSGGSLKIPHTQAQQIISAAAACRAEHMQPWPEEPTSAAHGILDDETYDWQSVIRATVATDGWPIVAHEDEILKANELASITDIPADHTGTAGLAGLLGFIRQSGTVPPGERIAVLFTGIQR